MKKHFIILMLLLFGSYHLFAQLEKGNWFIAGYSNLGLDIGKNKSKFDGTTTENYKYSYFYVSPEVGYFVVDKLTTGLFLDFDRAKETYENDDKYVDTKIIVGPFLRYYLFEYNKLWPYAEGRIGFGTERYSYSYDGDFVNKWNYFTTKLGVGATYFVANNFGIDLFMGYDYDSWIDKTESNISSKQGNSEGEAKDSYSSFEMNIGVVVTIGK